MWLPQCINIRLPCPVSRGYAADIVVRWAPHHSPLLDLNQYSPTAKYPHCHWVGVYNKSVKNYRKPIFRHFWNYRQHINIEKFRAFLTCMANSSMNALNVQKITKRRTSDKWFSTNAHPDEWLSNTALLPSNNANLFNTDILSRTNGLALFWCIFFQIALLDKIS